jgi:hypothetical protein
MWLRQFYWLPANTQVKIPTISARCSATRPTSRRSSSRTGSIATSAAVDRWNKEMSSWDRPHVGHHLRPTRASKAVAVDQLTLRSPTASCWRCSPSGCGKTTTAQRRRLRDARWRPDHFGDRRVTDFPEQRNIGMVFQNYVFPHMTVQRTYLRPRDAQDGCWQGGATAWPLFWKVQLRGLNGATLASSGGQQQRRWRWRSSLP